MVMVMVREMAAAAGLLPPPAAAGLLPPPPADGRNFYFLIQSAYRDVRKVGRLALAGWPGPAKPLGPADEKGAQRIARTETRPTPNPPLTHP